MNEENKNEFFAAVNSGNGFVSFYSDIFEREGIEHRYLIKGGPGTGKSTLMKRIVDEAFSRGLSLECYRCSSDPDSLDGVIIEGRIALMDATSPHCVEAKIAGAVDEIVDLGAFWDAEGLACELEKIKKLSSQKSDCYRGAYAYLSAALELDEHARELGQSLVCKEKMHKAACRISKKIKNGEKYTIKTGIADSIGMRGRYRLPTYENNAEKIYTIEDCFSIGSLFLGEIIEQAMKKRKKISVSYNPLNPKHPDAVFFEEEKIAFVICSAREPDKKVQKINMKRFVTLQKTGTDRDWMKHIRSAYRASIRIREGLIKAASDELDLAGKYHFELEEVYKKYMNFQKQQIFCDSFIRKILK